MTTTTPRDRTSTMTDTPEPTTTDLDATARGTSGSDPDQATDDPSTGEQTERTEETSPSHEAGRWRKKLRAVEQQRDDLAARLDVMHRREVARVATTPGRDEDGHPVPSLYDASDVFAADADLADLLDDDGHLDEGRIRAAIAAATEGRGHVRADLAPRPPRPTASQGTSSTEVGRRSAGEGWQSLLRGGR